MQKMAKNMVIWIGDQVAWPSKTHHSPDEAQELLSRPKRQKRSKKTIPVLDEDHSDCSIILFPGQGCQYVGMGQKALDKVQCSDSDTDEYICLIQHLFKIWSKRVSCSPP